MNKINQYFDFARIGRLFKMDLIKGWKEFLITMSAVCGFFLLFFLVSTKTGGIDNSVHYGYFGILLFIGLISTSASLKSAHRKLLNHDWLMLPASTFEKFLEKLLLNSVVYSVAVLVFYCLFSLLSYLIIDVIIGAYFPLFNPISSRILKMIGYYYLIQSVFMLGASWFKNKNFIKTILSIGVFWFIIGIITMIAGFLIFRADFWAMANSDYRGFNFHTNFNNDGFALFIDGLVIAVKILFYGLMAPVCWFGSWLKLKEVEVKDGI